jgi:hypothetical protein
VSGADHPSDEQTEHVERIPWAELVPEVRTARPWLPYLALAAVVGVAGWLLVDRRSSRSMTTVTLPTVTAFAGEVATIPPPPVVAEPAPAPRLYAEADLMAFVPVTDLQPIMARAEWFVTDFFTSDEDRRWEAELPAPAARSWEDVASELTSYVEWARAFTVTERSPGLFAVSVAFRALAAETGGAYRRLPVRAVLVLVAVDADGRPAIVDLPAPTGLPKARAEASWSPVEVEPPGDVAQRAIAEANEWGSEARVLSAAREGDGWRVVLEVVDSAGGRWPLAVRVPSS